MTNVANTVWNPVGGTEGEYSLGTAVGIVDPSAVQLVDPSGISVFDTGQTFSTIPATVWASSPGS